MPAKRFDQEEVQVIAGLYRSGLGVQAIADLYKVSYPTVSHAVKAAGIKARSFDYTLRSVWSVSVRSFSVSLKPNGAS